MIYQLKNSYGYVHKQLQQPEVKSTQTRSCADILSPSCQIKLKQAEVWSDFLIIFFGGGRFFPFSFLPFLPPSFTYLYYLLSFPPKILERDTIMSTSSPWPYLSIWKQDALAQIFKDDYISQQMYVVLDMLYFCVFHCFLLLNHNVTN